MLYGQRLSFSEFSLTYCSCFIWLGVAHIEFCGNTAIEFNKINKSFHRGPMQSLGGTNSKCLEHYNNIITKNHFLLLFGCFTSCVFSTPNCMNLSMSPLFRWQLLVEPVTTSDLSPKHYQLQDKLDSWLLGSSHSGTVFISDLSFFLCTLTKKGSRIRMEERGRAKREEWPLINGSRERKLEEHFSQKSWKSCCGTWKPKYIRLQQLLNMDAWPACGVGTHYNKY